MPATRHDPRQPGCRVDEEDGIEMLCADLRDQCGDARGIPASSFHMNAFTWGWFRTISPVYLLRIIPSQASGYRERNRASIGSVRMTSPRRSVRTTRILRVHSTGTGSGVRHAIIYPVRGSNSIKNESDAYPIARALQEDERRWKSFFSRWSSMIPCWNAVLSSPRSWHPSSSR